MARFVATRPFRIGNIPGPEGEIAIGDEVYFDGRFVELHGSRFDLVALHGAIRQGWLTEVGPKALDTSTSVVPKPTRLTRYKRPWVI